MKQTSLLLLLIFRVSDFNVSQPQVLYEAVDMNDISNQAVCSMKAFLLLQANHAYITQFL